MSSMQSPSTQEQNRWQRTGHALNAMSSLLAGRPSRRGRAAMDSLGEDWSRQSRSGFTILEVMLTVAVISALTGIVIIALNPTETFRKAYDAERTLNVKQLSNALMQQMMKEMELNPNIPKGKENVADICAPEGTCTGVDFKELIPEFLAAVPKDRAEPCIQKSGYGVYQESGRPFVLAAHLGKIPQEVPVPEEGCECPAPDGTVHTIASAGGIIYIGGAFTAVGGQSRNHLAAVDANCNLTSWNPNADGDVYAIATNGSTIYVGGAFTTMGTQARSNIASVDTSGNVLSWNPDANSTMYTLDVGGPILYAGGAFTMMGSKARNHAAALNPGDNPISSWDPDTNGDVYALTIDGDTVYVGGTFTSIGGNTRNRIAAVDRNTGTVQSWDPNADGSVRAIAVDGSNVYAGGEFLTIGGESRSRIAALDASTGSAKSWDPNADGSVRAIAVDGSNVYAGGEFLTIDAQTQEKFARLTSSE